MAELINAPPILQNYYNRILEMSAIVGVAKQDRLRAFVNKAYRTNKMDQINLVELAQLSVKNISAATRSLE